MSHPNLSLDRRGGLAFVLLLHFGFWLFFALCVHWSAPLHADMLEAFYWGQNFELGYYKHPPFWAWVCGIWFLILPTQNWAFLLLCMLNASIGLAGIYEVLGRFVSGIRRETAFLLLFLTPFYTFTIFQFNANTIFISLWPWAVFFFLKSLETRSIRHAVLFGVFGAAMMMSKYTAIFLLLSCLVAAVLHSTARSYFRSAAPWIAIITIVILSSPHLVWLMTHDYLPLNYIEGRTNNSAGYTLAKGLEFILSIVLQFGIVIGLVITAFWTSPRYLWRDTFKNVIGPDWQILFVLAFMPVLLMLLGGLFASVKLSVNLTHAFGFLVPLILICILSGDQVERLSQWTRSGIAAFFVLVALASPVIGFGIITMHKGQMTEPWIEATREAQAIWTRETRSPLRIATGSTGFGEALSFYGDGNPLQWTDLSVTKSPWITRNHVCHDGVLAICVSNDQICQTRMQNLAPGRIMSFDRTVKRVYWGVSGPERKISIYILPPNSCPITLDGL